MAFNYSGAPLNTYAAKDVAITQRPTSTAILGIDSADRFSNYAVARDSTALNNTNYSQWRFTLNKSESLQNGFFTRLALTEFYLPWTIPNVNRRSNEIVVTFFDAINPPVITNLTLEVGFYTPSLLASTLQTRIRALDASLAGFTMTYGIRTGISGVSQLPVFEYATNSLGGASIQFDPVPVDNLFVTPTTKQLFDILGFNGSNRILSGSPTTGGITFCNFTSYIDVVASVLTNNQALKDGSSSPVRRDVIARIYLADGSMPSNVSPSSSTFCPTGCAPFILYRDFASPKQINWLPNQPVPGSITFELYDDSGDPLLNSETPAPVQTNAENWAMTLLLTEN
jgi:hypothetical protein